jgi:CheY-like chemotaxis protein
MRLHYNPSLRRASSAAKMPLVSCSLWQAQQEAFTIPRMGPQKASPQRVLVVDDNEDAANSLALLLKLNGHETDSVYSAADALRRVTAFRPDTVLLDIGLPGMDGYEVAQHIRELPGLRGIRLVAVTGYGRLEDRQRAREAGFDDHLVKPVDLAVLEQALSGHRAERGA